MLQEDGYLYLRLRNMSLTMYAAKFEQTIIYQHVHLRRKVFKRNVRNKMLQVLDKVCHILVF
jgi:hypothetical protein